MCRNARHNNQKIYTSVVFLQSKALQNRASHFLPYITHSSKLSVTTRLCCTTNHNSRQERPFNAHAQMIYKIGNTHQSHYPTTCVLLSRAKQKPTDNNHSYTLLLLAYFWLYLQTQAEKYTQQNSLISPVILPYFCPCTTATTRSSRPSMKRHHHVLAWVSNNKYVGETALFYFIIRHCNACVIHFLTHSQPQFTAIPES